MEAMGIAQNLTKEENVVLARGKRSESVQMGLAQAARQRILAGISKTKVRYLGSRLTWNTAFAGWNASHMIGQFGEARVNFKFKCNVSKATVQVALLTGLFAFAGQNGSFTEGDLNQLEACQKKLARRLVAMTRRNLDTEPKKGQISTNELHRMLETVPIEMKLRIQRVGWGKKMAEHTTSAGSSFWTDALGEVPMDDGR